MPLLAYPLKYRVEDGLAPPDSGVLSDPNSTPGALDPRLPLPPPTTAPQSPAPPIPKPPPNNDTSAAASLAKLPPLNPDAGPKASYSGLAKVASMPPPGEPAPIAAQAAAQAAPAPPTPPQQIGTVDRAAATSQSGNPVDTAPVLPEDPKSGTENSAAVRAQRPEAPASNWGQRLGMAILSMTKLAPVANQIIHPKYSAQMGAYQGKLADATAQLGEEKEQAGMEAETERAGAYKAERMAHAANYAATQQATYQKEQDRVYDSFTKSLGPGAIQITADQVGQIPKGSVTTPDLKDPNTLWVRKAAFAPLTPELQQFFPDKNVGDLISSAEVDNAHHSLWKQLEDQAKAENKPDSSAKAKQDFQGIMTKVAAEGKLSPGAMSSIPQMVQAIKSSGVLTDQEKALGQSYLAANTTPAAQGTNMTLRMEGLMQSREYPVINKDTGQLEMRNSAEINASHGTFAPAGGGAQAMSKNAIFQDLHYNINTARNAIQSLDSMDAPTRAALAYTLRHTDPKSAMQSFLTGAAGTQLNPQQQEVVQSLALLAENAMALRSVAGLGQGSDEMRNAILATIPSAKTPSKGYGLAQLAKFENVVTRLERGVPGMGKAGNQGQQPAATKSAGGTVQMKAPNGQIQHVPEDQVEHYKSRGAVVVQ